METGDERPALPSKYAEIPLNALRTSTRKKLSLFLNLEGTLIDEVQCENNYRGIAELAGFSYLEIKNFEIQKRQSPTEEMLHDWTMRPELLPTVGNLWGNLIQLERDDVLTDCHAYIFKDCEVYLEKKAIFRPVEKPPVQEHTVSQSTESSRKPVSLITGPEVEKGAPVTYDAFVCYNPEGEDLEFVKLLINELEVKHNMKLFVPERDDLAGMADSSTSAELIKHRCKRMVIILSPRFLTSASCDFQTKFAQSLSPGARSKKLVPILIEKCEVPDIIRFVTLCDYTKKDLLQWFWTRLASSLKAPLEPIFMDPESSGSSGAVRSEIDQPSSSYSMSSGSSFSSSSSSNSSSLGSTSSSSSLSKSRSPKFFRSSKSQDKKKTNSAKLSSRQEDDYIMVSHQETVCQPPQLPPTGNRAPLSKPGSSTPPLNRGSQHNTAVTPPQKVYSSAQNKKALTSPVNRPLPKPPVENEDKSGDRVYFC